MADRAEIVSNSLTPKHVQLRGELSRLAAEMHPGDPIPSERVLMQRYEVSRATVRRAIDALVADGLLQRAPARGTFVAERTVESHLHLASFSQDMRRRGRVPRTRVLSVRQVDDAGATHGFLDGPTWRIERLRLADDEPMAHEVSHVLVSRAQGLDRFDLTDSLYTALAELGSPVETAEQRLWAEPADTQRATLLEMTKGAPVLTFDRYSRSGGTPLERTVSWYRGDRYVLHIDLDSAMTPKAASGA